MIASRFKYIVTLLMGIVIFSHACSRQLSQELIEEIRRGPEDAVLLSKNTRIPIVGSPTLPLVEVEVNGHGPFHMLIDVGSNVTTLRKNVVLASNVEILVDRQTSDIIRIDSLVVGAALFTNIVGASYDESDVDGVLGFNALRFFPFTIDYPNMVFMFENSGLPEADGEHILNYVLQRRMPYLPVVVQGDTLLFNFDTGAAEWFTLPVGWEKEVQLEGEPELGPILFNNQTGEVRIKIARVLQAFRFGSFEVRRPLVFLNADVDDAWFGSGFLQHFVLTFDSKNSRVQMQPKGEDSFMVPPYCTPGFKLTEQAGQWRITDIIPNTPASGQGLVLNDKVISVYLESGQEVSLNKIRSLVHCGEVLKINVLRGSKEVRFEVAVAALGK